MPYKDPEAKRAFQKEYCARPDVKEKKWATNMIEKYGSNAPEKYYELLEKQNGRCAICERPDVIGRSPNNKWSIDHDHETGEIRGLLCHHCNAGIGQLNDDPELLKKAISYLQPFRYSSNECTENFYSDYDN